MDTRGRHGGPQPGRDWIQGGEGLTEGEHTKGKKQITPEFSRSAVGAICWNELLCTEENEMYQIDIDPMQMPVCPICDNGMSRSEEVSIVVSREGGALGLAHMACVEDSEAESGQFGVGA